MGYRLYRSRRDRMLAGVAGGLAEMWGADPSLVRIIWALLVVFTGGVALLIYIVMAIVVPEEDEVFGPGGAPPRAAGSRPAMFEGGSAWRAPRADGGGVSPGLLLGGFFILIGLFFLAREFLPRIDFDWLGPLVLVAVGAVLIVSALGRGPRSSGQPAAPAPPPPPPSDAPPPPSPPPSEP
ncbi:MAG TPA: PspC domain-containing protein [Candidatus Limnocylindrales bacterium]|nr:PspC domain-containing protein [Candidatus Limnocylindrales bacterium]